MTKEAALGDAAGDTARGENGKAGLAALETLGDASRRPDRGRTGEAGPRKVAVFLQDLAGGGAERVMLQLAGGMAERGVGVDLVLVRPEGPYLADVPSGVRIVDLGTRRTVKSIPALARYLRRERPAALISALVHVNLAAILAAGLARVGTRVIITEHNQITRNAAIARAGLIRWAHRAVPWLYGRADEIVAVSDGVAQDLASFSGLPRAGIRVIHNPIVNPELLKLAEEAVAHPWFARKDAPLVLGAGRLNQQKDFATLIRAFSIMRRQRTARLVIIGEGPERPELERLVDRLQLREQVDLPGFVPNPYAMMRACDLFVLSSAWEGLPTVLVEALACGAPVVATDCHSGPREILEGGRYGRLVPVGDAEALGEAMAQTLGAPPPRSMLCARAGDFALERSVEAYLAVLFRERAESFERTKQLGLLR